jgi:hypothetical protein
MDYEFILKVAKEINLIHQDELWGNFCLVNESKTLLRFHNQYSDAMKEADLLRQQTIKQMDVSQLAELNKILLSTASDSEKKLPKNPEGRIRQIIKNLFS